MWRKHVPVLDAVWSSLWLNFSVIFPPLLCKSGSFSSWLASFMMAIWLQPTMLHDFSFISTGQEAHFCFCISCKILETRLSGTPRGHSWTGDCGRGTKRCFFGAWSQFPLKHIDAVRRGKRVQMPSCQTTHFYDRLTLSWEKLSIGWLIEGHSVPWRRGRVWNPDSHLWTPSSFQT